jgi:pyruvate dehydrogenase E2 component (dihydrolipoamide acetyltransferase)
MTEVIMAKFGDGMEEGTLLEWLKSEGDKVKAEEPIANIQTDKAIVELPAPASGKLAGLLVKPETTVAVGKTIAAILAEGESLPKDWGGNGAATPKIEASEKPKTPVPEAPKAAATPETNGGRAKVSPLARKIAESLGVDISRIQGSGPGGRIVEKDVRSFQDSGAVSPTGKPQELSRLRKLIAEHTLQATREQPHFYVTVEVDVDSLMELRAQMNEADPNRKISVNDFVLKAATRSLQDMPEVNSNYDKGKWVVSPSVNIGMAVATDAGLLVPVIKNCESKSIRQLSMASKELAMKARDNRLSLDEITGSTFSITNMGMLGVDNFAAIINYPNGAIVAVGTARRIPAVLPNDAIAPRWKMNLTGSFDHRTLDGAIGAKFMNLLRDGLQKPISLLE